jgi:ABC-type transport system substrate-binding protein
MIHDGIGMNTLRYPTNITAFRQAIVHAVNYTDLNQKIFFGSLSPLVGPEYRAEKDWYNLGNFPTYSFNATLAQQYLKQSGVDVSKLQPLEFRVVAGCQTCILAAQVVQADIASVLGVTVTVEVTPVAEMVVPYSSGYASYAGDVANGAAQTEAHMTWMGFPTFAPTAPDPADAWITFVNVNSPTGNFANYANPVVQKCVNAWFATSDVTAIKAVCTPAYAQVYNDAPYIWLGEATQCFGAGSVVWNKNVVQGFLMDPGFTGEATTAIFNTVVPAS